MLTCEWRLKPYLLFAPWLPHCRRLAKPYAGARAAGVPSSLINANAGGCLRPAVDPCNKVAAAPFSVDLIDWLSRTATEETGLPTHPLALCHMQLGPDRLPDAVSLELAEDVVDRRARRKAVAGQIPPGAAGAQQIQNGVHRCPHFGLARSSAWRRDGDQRLQPRTLSIPQIGRIAVALPPEYPKVLLRPHGWSPSRWSRHRESPRCARRNRLLGQAL